MSRFALIVFWGWFLVPCVCLFAVGFSGARAEHPALEQLERLCWWSLGLWLESMQFVGIWAMLALVRNPRPFLLLLRGWWSTLWRSGESSPRGRIVALCWTIAVVAFILTCWIGSIFQSADPMPWQLRLFGKLVEVLLFFMAGLGLMAS